jgi:transcriptional repressor NrdR
MRCPFCRNVDDKVIDSRSSEGGAVIRRRRECLSCKRRFTTYERAEEGIKVSVIKKDGSRVPYDRNKLIAGLQRATHKRPVSLEQLQGIVERVEEGMFRQFDKEVPSRFLAEQAARRLRKVDLVSYVRFASVYRQFQDVGEFIEQAQTALELAQHDAPGQQELFMQDGAGAIASNHTGSAGAGEQLKPSQKD